MNKTNSILQIQAMLKDNISVDPNRIKVFFKTGSSHYAEHDKFLGITVPNLRRISKNFKDLTLAEIKYFLASPYNEERLLALIIVVNQYAKADDQTKNKLYQFYLSNLHQVNNWNLVDASAHFIIGAHLWDKDRSMLLTLAKSSILWERRIAIVATWYFIRKSDFIWTYKIAEMLLKDAHDLIHKAVGWMLREAGKRNQHELINFLNQYALQMPRTMLRYAIEKLPDGKIYLLKKQCAK